MSKTDQILVIEDDELLLATLCNVLEREGYEVTTAHSAPRGLELMLERAFDLVITDVKLPGGMDGIDVLERSAQHRRIGGKSIVITGFDDKEAPIRAIRVGVDDYIYKPFQLEQFTHAVKKSLAQLKMERDAAHYRELSIRDGLTDLFNHRYFHEIAERELLRARRYGSCISLMLVDIDRFKDFNDTHGHLMGDMALRAVARVFGSVLRGSDLAFRYGGEEFAVLLPETDTPGGFHTGQRLRRAVAELPLQVTDGRVVSLTISVGVASYPMHAESKMDLIARADEALYRAKGEGRDRVVVYAPALA